MSRAAKRAGTGRNSARTFNTAAFRLPVCAVSVAAMTIWLVGCRSTSTVRSSIAVLPQLAASRYAAGRRLSYQIKYTSDSSADLSSVFGAQSAAVAVEGGDDLSASVNSFHTEITGKLSTTVLRQAPEGAVVAYRLTDAELNVMNGRSLSADSEKLKSDLSEGVFALVSPQGRVLSVRFAKDSGYASQSFGRALLGITQFVLPNKATADTRSWDAQEDDPAGAYTAHYALADVDTSVAQESETQLRIKKTKAQYIASASRRRSYGVKLTRTVEPQSGFVAAFDSANGRLISLEGTEVEDVAASGRQVGHAADSLRLAFSAEDAPDPAEVSALDRRYSELEKAATALPLSASMTPEQQRLAIETKALGDATLKGLMSKLADAEAAPDKANSTQLFLKLKALIYTHQETCDVFGKILSEAPPDSLTTRLVAQALGAAGNPEAQQALVRGIKARPNDEASFTLLSFILARTENPTPQSEKALDEVAFNEPDSANGATAQLMLGLMAHNIDETDHERAGKIVARLIDLLQSPSTPGGPRRLLSALGNSGSTAALPVIAPYLKDPSPDSRAAAAFALRWVDSDEADDLLADAVTHDPDAFVRYEAVSALSYREMNATDYEAEKRAALTDTEARVRLAALKNLWQFRGSLLDAVETAKRLAADDSSEEVRNAASELIRNQT